MCSTFRAGSGLCFGPKDKAWTSVDPSQEKLRLQGRRQRGCQRLEWEGRADVHVHTSWDTSTRGKCPHLTCIVPIFPKEFWTLTNIRLQNIQKFSGRQREICIENLFRFLLRARLTLRLLSSHKPDCVFPPRGITDRKGSTRDGGGGMERHKSGANPPSVRLSVWSVARVHCTGTTLFFSRNLERTGGCESLKTKQKSGTGRWGPCDTETTVNPLFFF